MGAVQNRDVTVRNPGVKKTLRLFRYPQRLILLSLGVVAVDRTSVRKRGNQILLNPETVFINQRIGDG